jgi:glycosyltransferase involved in cell wall biosynthesis
MTDVSAIILSHNAAAYVGAAIESTLAQTHRPAEVLVVDDSTDDGPTIVERYAGRSAGVVKLMRVEPCNVSRARNIALEHSGGDYVSFLDADDIWLPRKIESQVKALEADREAIGAYAPYFDFVDTIDDRGRHVPKPGIDDPTLGDVLARQNMCSSTILFRRSMAADLRFDEHAPDGEDTIFVAELRLRGRWRRVDVPLVAKRIHGGQASGSLRHQVRNTKTRLAWVRANRDRIGPDEARDIEADLSARFIGSLEGRYWRRELTGLKAMCAEAQAMCPAAFAESFLSRTRLFPRWVYRVRDLVRPRK